MVFHKAPNEEIVFRFTSGRFGWKYVKVYGFLALVFLAGVALLLYGDSLLRPALGFLPFTPSGISTYVMAAAAILAVPVELKRRSLRYIITNYRVVEISGLLKKRAKALQISQINDVSVDQSFIDRLLGHGDVIVKTETSTMEMRAVHDPSKIESLLMEHSQSRVSAPRETAPRSRQEKPPGGYATSSP